MNLHPKTQLHHQNEKSKSRNFEFGSASNTKNNDSEIKATENHEEEQADRMEFEGELGLDGRREEPGIGTSNNVHNVVESPEPALTYTPPFPQSPEGSPDRVSNFQSESRIDMEDMNFRARDLLMSVLVNVDSNKQNIIDHVVAAMEELHAKALYDGPSRVTRTSKGKDPIQVDELGSLNAKLFANTRRSEEGGSSQTIPNIENNMEYRGELGEYNSMYQRQFHPNPFRVEISREVGYVYIQPLTLVKILMEVNQWSYMFSTIVSRPKTLGIISKGAVGGLNGAIHVISAEFHIPSPLVPTRESCFARYSRELAPGTWAVVDVSLENLFPGPTLKYHRKPSGCLIQALQDGYSKIIWLEQAEVDDRSVPHIFKPLVVSGFAFGAKRWIATLIRKCERLATIVASRNPVLYDGVVLHQASKRSLLKLGERMMRTFGHDVSASSENVWIPLPRAEDTIMVMLTSSINDPGRPSGVAVVLATSLWIAHPPQKVFNFLTDVNSRAKWDILLYGRKIRELAHISHGQHPGTCVSIMEVITIDNQFPMMYLQECYSNPTGSYIVYAPVEMLAMTSILNGENSDNVAILPSGFAILPDRPTKNGFDIDGSLLTLSFQLLDSDSTRNYIPPSSVETIYKLISDTVYYIETALS